MRRPGTRPPLTAKRERSAATKEVTASSRGWVPAFADDICRVRDSKLADLDAAQSRQVALYRDGICKPWLGAWGDAPDPRGSHTPQVIAEKSRGLAVSQVAKVAADLAYHGQSPITYAARIKTPTLILSTTGDARVPVTQSYRLYHALKDNGVTMRFVAWPVPGTSPPTQCARAPCTASGSDGSTPISTRSRRGRPHRRCPAKRPRSCRTI